MNHKFYNLVESQDKSEAHLYIFGDILEYEWVESDVTPACIVTELEKLDVSHIICHINSYGGHVSAGLAIYNALKSHKAKITTIVDGFACSIASAIFMAGEERIMNSASMLMIHNVWNYTCGNANELRKTADDLEKMTDVVCNTYREAGLTISDEELKNMLDAESWLTPSEALDSGFATSIQKATESDKAAANVRDCIMTLIMAGLTAKFGEKDAKVAKAAELQISIDAINELSDRLKAMENEMRELKGANEAGQLPQDQNETVPNSAVNKSAALIRAVNNHINKN